MKHRYQSYADWTSVPVPRTPSLRGLDVGFIPLLPKELPYMANNDEYTDEYNDEYLCRDFFVGFNFLSRLSFQISEFRVHWFHSPSAKGVALYGEQWRIMTNTMTNSYVVIFLSLSIFGRGIGRGYHSRYQNFEFTGG